MTQIKAIVWQIAYTSLNRHCLGCVLIETKDVVFTVVSLETVRVVWIVSWLRPKMWFSQRSVWRLWGLSGLCPWLRPGPWFITDSAHTQQSCTQTFVICPTCQHTPTNCYLPDAPPHSTAIFQSTYSSPYKPTLCVGHQQWYSANHCWSALHN